MLGRKTCPSHFYTKVVPTGTRIAILVICQVVCGRAAADRRLCRSFLGRLWTISFLSFYSRYNNEVQGRLVPHLLRKCFFIIIGVHLFYNTVLASAVQQSASAVYISIYR